MEKQAFKIIVLLLILILSQLTFAMENSSTYHLRTERKVGAGLAVGGSNGLIGAIIDLNLEEQNGALAGFGFGTGYNTLSFAWKNVQDFGYLSTFTKLGYSRWYNSYGSVDYNNSSILKNVLTEEQKSKSVFTTDFLIGGLGAQYTELGEDFNGISYYMELELIMDLHNTKVFPTGNVGSIYYF